MPNYYTPSSPADRVLSLLDNVKQNGNKMTARCPAHDDQHNSLSVGVGVDGRVLIHCFAGCISDDIVAALGLTMADLAPQGNRQRDGSLATTYNYTDERGALLYQVVRLEPKSFKQRRPDGRGGWVWDLAGVRRVLYRLPDVIAAVTVGKTIFIVEGERDADNLYHQGLTATTNAGGAGRWLSEYSPFLCNAYVVIIPDNDEPGRKHAWKVAGALQGVAAEVRILSLPDLPEKGDVSDWLQASGSAEMLEHLAQKTAIWTPPLVPVNDEGQHTCKDKKPSAAQQLVEIGRACQLFVSDRDEPFARIKVGDWHETWPVRSKRFRNWLRGEYYVRYQKPASTPALEDCLGVFEATCLFGEGKKCPLFVRTASHESALWFDLGDSRWRGIRVTAQGWEVAVEPPILFRRYMALAPQVEPVQEGNLERLRPFLNVRDENAWRLVVVWLVAAFFPDIAHPVLVVHGEQGSAKSTHMRLLSRLIDPSHTELRAEPRDIAEWVQMADHSWLVTLDNVSVLPGWLSDAICRAVTGESFSKRQLYTDSDDVILSFRRVVALTGIEVVAQRADLLDRAILHGLEPITPDKRRLEAQVLAEFDQARPAILGALLDTVAGVLRELPKVHLSQMPRMADFARVGVAVERALHWPVGSFMDAYTGNIGAQNEEALAASSVGEAIRSFIVEHVAWHGTPKELLEALNEQDDTTKKRPQDWPKTPRALSGQLKRIAPNLRAAGINIAFEARNAKGRRLTMRKTEETTVTTVTNDTRFRHIQTARVTVVEPAVTVSKQSMMVKTPAVHRESDCYDGCDGWSDDFSNDLFSEDVSEEGDL